MKCRALLLASALAAVLALRTEAAVVTADFNDLTAGALNGKAGGTGWTGTWSGSAIGAVAAGDLTSSLYAITQSGTGEHIQNGNTTGLRQNFRIPTTALTGEVWFSYLARTTATTTGAGMSFNASTLTPFQDPGNAFLQFVGTSLIYRFGQASDQTLTNQVTINSTALVVGQMILNGGGAADTIKLWVNPNLIADPNIFDYTPVISSSALNFADSITTIGAIMHNNTGSSTTITGQLDVIRLSDGGGNAATAYLDVTGVPEPSAAALVGMGVALFGMARRRCR